MGNVALESAPVKRNMSTTYPGTATERLKNAVERVKTIDQEGLNAEWEKVRVKLLWAAGLKDLQNVAPGRGNTSHCFNDYIHCDAATMLGDVQFSENEDRVKGIQRSNQLGYGIVAASDKDMGPGGSWCTCMNGCDQEPPQDVAHMQFQSKIAWKLVWAPKNNYQSFVLVDDDGNFLAKGTPTGSMPSLYHRQRNYELVKGSKYATAADGL